MEKIKFSNYQEPGVSAETLNQMQDNIENAINGDETWQNLNLSNNFKVYNDTSSNAPVFKKAGNVVELIGTISPAKTIEGSSTQVLIGTLPTGFRPKKSLRKLCQGTGKNTWLLNIDTNGEVSFSRYGITGFENAGISVWLPFEVSFFVS